jgi:DNA invertase Pin-like site-specific DNA recombinase
MTRLEEPHEYVQETDGVAYDAGANDDMNALRTSLGIDPGLAREIVANNIERHPAQAIIYVRVSTKAQAERDGNPEGYSLPTQRTACRLRAEQLGAEVVDEYIDKDTGTRVDKRPAMLALIERVTQKRDINYVIVHQLSRFARNRLDDASITDRLEMAGAVLISCMEGIDQTTPGRMLQGMLAVVNEYQSRNQSDDIKRKTLQKVKDGGTPALAPIGYLNVQGGGSDKNKRWIEIDPVRAEHIRWAFDAYASGTYSLRDLAVTLEMRGLTQRSTTRRPERPLPTNKLHHVLRNRYYTGIVIYKGIEYEGKHPPIVDAVTFDEVQRLLDAHRLSGERAHRHTHYLKGSLRCFRCKSRLAYCVSRGNGGSYGYFFCLGRHERRTDCDLPYLSHEAVEAAVVDFYLGDHLKP